MADLSKVNVKGTVYNLKDSQARADIITANGLISAEETRAKSAEGALDTRVTNLEARGRFLSNYVVATGLPTTYPDIPASATTTYTYTFKSGDYYIVGSVPSSGKKYMPSGSSITATKSGDTWTWEVGKAETTEAIAVGDQFVFDGTNWVHIAAAKDVVWGNIVGSLADQEDLSTELGKKAETDDLGALAFADTATGEVAAQTVSGVKATGTLSAALTGTLGESDASATISTKDDFTPAGTLKVDGNAQATGNKVLKGGSIAVAVKDAANATDATIATSSTYTPTGNVTGKVSVPNAAAIASTVGEETGYTVTGTVSKPAITVTPVTDTVQEMKTAGTAYTISDGDVSKGKDSTSKFVKKAYDFSVGTGEASETLIIQAVENTDTTFYDSAVTASGSISYTKQELSGALPTFGKSTALVTSATAALDAAPTFTADNKLKISLTNSDADITAAFAATNNVSVPTKITYLKQVIDADNTGFTGTEAELTFAGTEVKDLIPSAIGYKKTTIGTLAATAALPEGGLAVGDIVVPAQNVTVSPDAE